MRCLIVLGLAAGVIGISRYFALQPPILPCLIIFAVLAGAIANGLLGRPDMQITGNGSSAYALNWYQDRAGQTLPQPSIISVPLWIYRVLMLAWALWLAMAVLNWLRWGWQSLNVGGLWMKRPPK